MKNSSLFQKSNNKEKHFLKRDTKRFAQIIPSLSLSLFVRAKRTFFGRKRETSNVKREREGKERERVSAFLFLFGERKRKRERISILKSRDFLPFVLTLAFTTRVYITSAKAATRAFPGNAFSCAFSLRERKNVSEQQKTRHVAKRGPRLHLPSHQQSPLSNAITQLGEKV
jgi:hypothetical protein